MSDVPIIGPLVDRGSRSVVSGSLLEQIYEALRNRIVTGQFVAGKRLPPSRKFAEELGVSRTTVVTAYDQLIAEGFAYGRAGSGVYVSEIGEVELEPLGSQGDFLKNESTRSAADLKPFQPGQPDMRLFPYRQWARCFARVARTDPMALVTGGDPFGDLALRAEICRYLLEWRGVKATPQQVMITAGSEDALEKCIRTLTKQGDRIALEDPGYPPVRRYVCSLGLRTSWLKLDDQGAIPPRLMGKVEHPALVVLTPSSQFPLGGAMPHGRRNEFLNWAAHNGGWIIEDDYDSEFRYAGRPIPALAGLDKQDRTLYVGSFSKVISSGLRLGFLVTPKSLVADFAATLLRDGQKASIAPQRALALFMQSGDFYRHIRKVRRIYGERRGALMEMLHAEFGQLASFKDHRAGMQIVLNLPQGCDDREVSELAARAGIHCPALSSYSASAPVQPGLVLGFCSFTASEMEAAMCRLQAIIKASIKA